MDDLTLRYYDAEMRYLLEAGEEFARAHPEQARACSGTTAAPGALYAGWIRAGASSLTAASG
ncbi:type VI secretion system baseplate subunit TssF [Erwinia persicina]|nr:type VI secretion system baseplate subunit TssF [Erwinia persicina]MCQ4104429.1 type VI secretion system baseplate subunit TssF [Erwinia persicina]UTX14111.1 type VI secretion system baseplate subunit TssF [Erwinia persicina]